MWRSSSLQTRPYRGSRALVAAVFISIPRAPIAEDGANYQQEDRREKENSRSHTRAHSGLPSGLCLTSFLEQQTVRL